MQLVIKDGKVEATYPDDVDILDKYDLTQYEIISWDGPGVFAADRVTGESADDPRTLAQRIADARLRYLRLRLKAYPSVRECLAMIYRDMRDGTSTYVDTITAINSQFPKPE